MSLFQQSSLSFGEAKIWVAEQHNKQTSPDMLVRAGRAIQRAVKDWNRYKWEWLITEGTSITVTGGLTNTKYPVPYDYRDMYNLVFTQAGIPRALVQDNKRGYDRVSPQPIASVSTGYNLIRIGDLGKFELQDPPNAGGTIKLLYYRRMHVPCVVTGRTLTEYNVSSSSMPARLYLSSTAGIQVGSPVSVVFTPPPIPGDPPIQPDDVQLAETGTIVVGVNDQYIEISSDLVLPVDVEDPITSVVSVGGDNYLLDIHTDFEWGLLARACEHFLASVGASETKLSYWMAAAAKGIEDALAAQADKDDRELCFEPLPHFGSYNPNRIVE